MKTYEELRPFIDTGDVVLAKDRTLEGIIIRVFTAESTNHAAVFVWLGEGLFIAEMTMRYGFRMIPASEWFEARQNSELLYCQAPQSVRDKADIIKKKILLARSRQYRYSYITLIRVWLSQIFNRSMQGLFVCSTFIQDLWEATGYSRFKRLADPGDFILLAWSSTPVRWKNGT